MEIDFESVDELYSGHCTAGEVAKPLTDLAFHLLKGVLLRAPGNSDPIPNTAPVYIGGKNVTINGETTGGMALLPGESMFLPMSRPSALFVITTGEQKIQWIGI